ncbi:hypothetical protein M407DRAFT_245540 [Tulasnella calospora MUT 4182]|uniref:Uncharacterized protein n=1 Tax=Tulasnella calospora MUT 4182 TaxID=1051891 RepID=A0A0C3KID3_9AGAM|nr:hypothetical protein M407DRAFT_245540 [Tulasnella calospora MUT 4182]
MSRKLGSHLDLERLLSQCFDHVERVPAGSGISPRSEPFLPQARPLSKQPVK